MALLLIGGFYNIDLSFKAHMLSELILATDIPFKHTDRIMLAIVLHTAFGSECSKYLVNISKRLLSKQNYDNACVMGHFISICMIVDGPTFNKPEFELKPVNNIFELSAGRILSKPIFDQARSHLKEVAFLKKKATGAISWNSDRPIDEDELE
jgi:exopolyphosphatase/guanosine-5'-triphosphate,3'-diphosphate pyrophosphatase